MQLVDSIASEWMTPFDWQQTAKPCLSAGQYLLWKADYEDRAKQVAQRGLFKKSQDKITLSMLTGSDEFYSPQAQLHLPKAALKEILKLAVTAWRQLPASDIKTTFLGNVKQGPEESYEEFLAKLEDNVSKAITNPEAAALILKQLAFKNANPMCQDLLRPVRRTGTIRDFIKTCLEASPAYIQVMVKWKGLLTGQWKGPDVLLTSGRGYACVFPQDADAPI